MADSTGASDGRRNERGAGAGHLHPILFCGTTFATGGAERIFSYLVEGLNRSPFRTELLALRELGPIGEEIQSRGIPSHTGLTGSGKLDPFLIPRLRRFLRRGRYEAIYFLDHAHAVFYGTLASLGTSVRARVMPVHTMRQWGGQPSLKRPIRLVLPFLGRIIAIAEAQKRYLIEEEGVPAGKVTVIPNGIPLETPGREERLRRRREVRAEMGVADDVPVVGITAVLRPEKNHALLLEAFARVRSELPAAELWIVGDGLERPRLEELARRLSLDRSVRFLGYQQNARRLFAGMDVAALASHPRVETLPLSLMEAMDAGLPVIATRVGALDELVDEGTSGFLVEPGDAVQLTASVLRVLRDPDLRFRLGAQGQERCRREFGVSRMVDATARLLDRLTGGIQP